MTHEENNKTLVDCSYCDSCYSCSACDSCSSCSSCSACSACYYCFYSKDLRMSENMIFCLGDGKYARQGGGYQKNDMIFNKQVTKEEFWGVHYSLPNIKLDFKDLTYEKAWAKWWSEAKQEDKDKILNCGYFDQEIFIGITGITETKQTWQEEIEEYGELHNTNCDVNNEDACNCENMEKIKAFVEKHLKR